MRPTKPLEIVVYQDVLCAWCYVADARLVEVRRVFGDTVRWIHRPYALRLRDSVPTQKELHEWVAELERARREPEGRALSKELWLANDPPRSSIPALAALEAARLQGREKRDQLAAAMRRAALELGLNVTRPDITLELASSLGLDMNRFFAAWKSPQTRKLILEEHRLASERGVRGVPTLVIGARWMLSGLREVGEYVQHIASCLQKHEHGEPMSGGPQMLH
ncbi:MAG: DsbA family protein [Myxococcaceae bacterium]|nr:DsbA family protein [Myxococcaceae bacterium]